MKDMPAKDWIALLQALSTLLLVIVGGAWAFWKFKVREERYPHIETSADINVIGEHSDYWVVELIACIENKGSAQHKMKELNFDLYALNHDDALLDADQFGGQVFFPHLIKDGSFLPGHSSFFFIDPGITAKYSFITKVPKSASFVMFHYRFRYADKRNYGHTAERTITLPKSKEQQPPILS